MTNTTQGDLVKRLRKADEYKPLGHDGWEAADRIDELEAKLAQQDDLVQAAVAAALTEAAKIPDQWIGCEPITSGILALITPDAQAALDRVVAEARVDGAEIARQTVWDKLHGSQQAEQLCDAIDAAIREGSNERSEEGE